MKLIIILTFVTLFCSCRKEYSCYCPDPLSCDAFPIKADSKANAKKKCENKKNPYNDSKCYLIH